ncbi:unnamed protein product [Mytilus coruscus]|uniref:Reverse transcriptase domain-containing protein n=1 Tax=Mytilus coruscus TaxID=42192 RepID=A0A6J8BBS8_MYTCO|nr:unnamed protein product [Mytilus coruscus]
MWSEHQKGLYFAVSLNGKAQAVLGDLPKEKRQIFSDLVNALEERFAPSSQTELYRVHFKERRQKASETLPELGQSVRRLSNLACTTAPLELRDTLSKEQFLDALVDSEMRLKIRQSRLKGLNDAIRLAVELEAYNKAESRTLKSIGHLRQTTSDEQTKASNSPDTVKQSTRGVHTKGPDTDGSVKTLKSGDKVANKDKGAVLSASEDAGIFVELLIHVILVKFVVDTGATLTLVSTKVYDLIPDLYKSQIKSACGNYLNLRGKGNFTLDFGTEKFTSEAVVTELQVDGILGTLGCFRVVSTESVTIPARSEIVVSGKVCLPEGQTLPKNDVLVEASENKGKDYILTARSLVKSNDSIPVRLMNVENEAKNIFPGNYCKVVKLNCVTINKDAYPPPRIDESLDHLAGNSWFSTLDCCSGYWKVELAEKDKHKTAFATRKGLFQFKVIPFGLCCAAQTFERLMETVLAGLQWEICLVYLDDIIVFGKTLDDMLVNVKTVFDRLKSAGLKLKAKKCNLCVTMTENKKEDYMGTCKPDERNVVCNTELGRIISQKTTPRLPGVRSTFAGRQGLVKHTDEKGIPVDKPGEVKSMRRIVLHSVQNVGKGK